jgi:hypothetical protein
MDSSMESTLRSILQELTSLKNVKSEYDDEAQVEILATCSKCKLIASSVRSMQSQPIGVNIVNRKIVVTSNIVLDCLNHLTKGGKLNKVIRCLVIVDKLKRAYFKNPYDDAAQMCTSIGLCPAQLQGWPRLLGTM